MEMRILSGRFQIECPHENCRHNYGMRQCKSLLSKANFDILKKRRAEAATPLSLRLYCPYNDCSAFMKKPKSSSSTIETSVKCKSCSRDFCLECNIPWHANKTCNEIRAEAENSKLAGDEKLRDLAQQWKWQICGECKRVVERTSGCNHITCV